MTNRSGWYDFNQERILITILQDINYFQIIPTCFSFQPYPLLASAVKNEPILIALFVGMPQFHETKHQHNTRIIILDDCRRQAVFVF